MDYEKNINVFSFWKVRHVELRLKVGVCGSEDRAEMMPSLESMTTHRQTTGRHDNSPTCTCK